MAALNYEISEFEDEKDFIELNKAEHIENQKIFQNFYMNFNKNFIYNLNMENYMILK